jgi:site-specific DNA-methyltransferase (adenine-specific)
MVLDTASVGEGCAHAETSDGRWSGPPYNIGVGYRSYDDRQPRESYLQWLTAIGSQIGRVLKSEG